MNNDEPPSDALRLKSLLKGADINSSRLDSARRLAMFPGRTRDWSFVARLANGWFNVHAYVCEIPEVVGLRAALLDLAMAANQEMSLTKFVKANGLYLEVDYQAEHLDAEVVGNIFGLLVSNAEEYYPRLFRVVSGDAVLEALDKPQLSGAA